MEREVTSRSSWERMKGGRGGRGGMAQFQPGPRKLMRRSEVHLKRSRKLDG